MKTASWTALARATLLITLAAALGAGGCKSKEDREDERATGGVKHNSKRSRRGGGSSIDLAAAHKALLAAPWKGVVAGKPALITFKKSRKPNTVWAVMTLGSKVEGCRVAIRRGHLSISTRGNPTSRGITRLSLYGKLSPPYKQVSGKVSRSHKRGFMESSSGIGDFQLAQGDAKTAMTFYRSSCDARSYASCYQLAVAYLRGDGVPKDGEQMVKYFDKACVGGMVKACGALGVVYLEGKAGIKKNIKKVKAYWGKACDDGHTPSCRDLGHIYRDAQWRKALRYYAKACAKKDAMACNGYAWEAAKRGKQLDRALAAARKAVKLDPKAAFIDTLAWVYYKRKNYPRAELEAKRAHSMKPDNAEFEQHLAAIRKAMK